MGVVSVQFHSEALGKYVTYNAIVPEKGDGPFPVLMQLHGLHDDHSGWIQKSNILRYASEYQVVVIFPDGGTSRYLNWPALEHWGQHRYEDFMVNDIPENVRRTFRVQEGPWAIGGLSMGGFGCMRLGVKYPEKFASIWAHSAVYWMEPALKAAVADGEDAEILPHIEALKAAGSWPSINFDCGVDDFLIEHNRWLHAELDRLEIDHTYNEHPGAHTWEYWDEHVQTALAHHAGVMGWELAPKEEDGE